METFAAIFTGIGALAVFALFCEGLYDGGGRGHLVVWAAIICLQVPCFFYLHNLSWKREAVREGVARWEFKTLPDGETETVFAWNTVKK